MANRDDVDRGLAECVDCGSIYAAREWPTGEIQPIGSDGCECGSTDFVLVDDVDEESNGAPT
ncbi:hypothetical protein [Natronobacterium texcoconense]|uniref:Uncharacterized protein n=1 Tax=Natronobacterium texcoconense TaxID=1095778 RepID=A0A1H1J4W1_NATTX|nr:hypothetical protein [Natronobacterium texcoconense]SDR44953.1 hypothetical protein SAMN04489842_4134 [Natronobacterium texcoconense]